MGGLSRNPPDPDLRILADPLGIFFWIWMAVIGPNFQIGFQPDPSTSHSPTDSYGIPGQNSGNSGTWLGIPKPIYLHYLYIILLKRRDRFPGGGQLQAPGMAISLPKEIPVRQSEIRGFLFFPFVCFLLSDSGLACHIFKFYRVCWGVSQVRLSFASVFICTSASWRFRKTNHATFPSAARRHACLLLNIQVAYVM